MILDTEAMKREPNPAVKEWLNQMAVETLYLSIIVLDALLFGVVELLNDKRQSKTSAALTRAS